MDINRVAAAIAKVPHSSDCATNKGKWYIVEPIREDGLQEDVKGWYGLACTCNREQRIAAIVSKTLDKVLEMGMFDDPDRVVFSILEGG